MGAELKGLEQTKRSLRAKLDEIDDGAKALVEEAGIKTARKAKARVPVDTGDLRNSIRHEHTRTPHGATSTVKAGVGLEKPEVAAFVEFGTGVGFSAPPELHQYAKNWFVSGLGRLPAHPYLFPSFSEARRDLVESLRKL